MYAGVPTKLMALLWLSSSNLYKEQQQSSYLYDWIYWDLHFHQKTKYTH